MARKTYSDTETDLETPPAPVVRDDWVAPEPAAVRLRAFEDEHFGTDVMRINGKIERGSGSPFQKMSDADKAKYAAIERLIETEQKLAEAHAALMTAESEHEAACAALEPKPDAAAPQ